MKKILVLWFSLILPYAFSQDEEERKLFVGVNVGTKIGNKNYAQRYAGWYNNQLEDVMVNTSTNYYQIYTRLGDKDFYLPYDFFPQRMRYAPGLVTGVLVGYSISPNLQTSVDFNFSKLSSRDVFSIVVIDPNNTTSQEQYQLGELLAKESRFDGRFNFDYMADGEKFRFILGLSGLFTGWRIDGHTATFSGYVMPLFSKHNPLNNITYRVRSSGWGVGANFGVNYRFSEQFVAQLMYQPYHSQMNVGIVPNKKLLLHHDIVLRILWK
jgi:hypothetical protein